MASMKAEKLVKAIDSTTKAPPSKLTPTKASPKLQEPPRKAEQKSTRKKLHKEAEPPYAKVKPVMTKRKGIAAKANTRSSSTKCNSSKQKIQCHKNDIIDVDIDETDQSNGIPDTDGSKV